MNHEIRQKWGFGMAPPKAETQAKRLQAAEIVTAFLDSDIRGERLPAALSEVKGLFSRIGRQDQWDWFATSRTLGYPSARMTNLVANAIGRLRRALVDDDAAELREQWLLLRRIPCRPCLRILLGTARIVDEAGAGWIYLLSTREMPDVLKIGMTTRTVEERVREINGATGVVFPFGVRRCWRTNDPATAERLIHEALAEHRVRADREFFRARFGEAASIIDETLSAHDLELRTLDNLEAVPISA
jgi:T5orf172 domain